MQLVCITQVVCHIQVAYMNMKLRWILRDLLKKGVCVYLILISVVR